MAASSRGSPDQLKQVHFRHDPQELLLLHDEDGGLAFEKARGPVDAHVAPRDRAATRRARGTSSLRGG